MDLFENIKDITLIDNEEYNNQINDIEINYKYIQVVFKNNVYNLFYKGVFVAELYSLAKLSDDEILELCYDDIKETIFRCNLTNKEYKNMLSDEELLDSLDW